VFGKETELREYDEETRPQAITPVVEYERPGASNPEPVISQISPPMPEAPTERPVDEFATDDSDKDVVYAAIDELNAKAEEAGLAGDKKTVRELNRQKIELLESLK